MKFKLSDWLSIRWGTEQVMDAAVQLLAFTHEEIGKYLNPDVFYLEFPEDDPTFGELKQEKQADAFDPVYKPFRVVGGEADDMFVLGLMLYRVLTGREPEVGLARFLMGKVSGSQEVPLLHVPQSSLNPLIRRLTDLNPSTRISRAGALEMLAKLWNGRALISVTEEQSGAVLDNIEVPLTGAVTEWRSPYRLHYGDMLLLPSRQKEFRIPLRICTKSYPLYVKVQSEAPPACSGDLLRKPGYAVDLGSGGLRLIGLGSRECCEEIVTISAYAAVLKKGKFLFGEEAQALIRAGKAGSIVCTYEDADKIQRLLAADGTMVEITAREATEALMKDVYRMALEMGMPANERIAMTLSAGWNTEKRTFWFHAAQDAGFRTMAVPAPLAILLCHSLYEPSEGNVMIVDAGTASVDVCVLRCGHACTPRRVTELVGAVRQSYSAPGGGEMTTLLEADLLRRLREQYGMDLTSSETAGLEPEVFDRLRARIRAAAEQIKRKLSFKEQAEEHMTLDGAEPPEVKFVCTRTELRTLLEPIGQRLRQAMEQACAGSNLPRDEIQTAVLTGGSSLNPVVRETVAAFFEASDCRIIYRDKSYTAVRGAAFFPSLCGTDVQSQVVRRLISDVGILTATSIRQLPEFRVLLSSGTAVPDEAEITFRTLLSEADLDRRENCRLRIYTRPTGMEHVRNTLDPEGACIRIMGKLLIPLPDDFRLMEDELEVHMTYQPDETIKAEARVCRKKKFGLFARNAEQDKFTDAIYLPGL